MQKSDDYYKSIGFMCGLEIHQRLLTDAKLFCACNAKIREKADAIKKVERRQRAVAGELGKVDKSTAFEEGKQRSFIYRAFKDSTCLVDIDEEPPHEMNIDALMIAISLSQSMGTKLVDEFQPMRKAVVDGSDPSAFQRTIMVAMDGKIEVNGTSIGIPSIFLEEESSGIFQANENSVVYDTDRLGVPLIEIDTDPSIPTPQAAKDVALYLGTLLRVTGRVQRGIGSIRQDVNVSIRGGARVEIKGVQELSFIDKYLENEVRRQQELIAIKTELEKRKAAVERPNDVTPIFKNGNAKILSSAECVVGFRLAGFEGLLGKEINPERRLGTEISDYAKMGGVKGLIHSDEDMDKYGISPAELKSLKESLGIRKGDAFILIAGEKQKAHRAAEHATWRARHAIEGIPKETRGANNTDLCTSRFMRPLPGGSRMYPETDVRPILLTDAMIKESESLAPNLENEKAYIKSKVRNTQLASQLILSQKLQLFKDIIKNTKADPEFVANFLIQKLTELRRNGFNSDDIDDERMTEIFKSYAEDKITKNGLEEVVKELCKKDSSIEELISRLKLKRIKGKELDAIVNSFREKLKTKDKSLLRNEIMAKHRLNVDGEELNKLL